MRGEAVSISNKISNESDEVVCIERVLTELNDRCFFL